jgi:hypothetical protein
MNYINLQTFNNLGILSYNLSQDQIMPIKEEIESIKNNFDTSVTSNHYLLGNIKKEFELITSKSYLEKLITPLLISYDQNFDYLQRISVLSNDAPIVLKNAWVNFQSKTEFNPNHNHDGVFSFVIWTNVPYDIEQEKEFSPGYISKQNLAGCFEFQYTNILGEIYSHIIHVDKSLENTLVLFPAKLRHCVYPFYTSDDYRISVSGNFVLDVKQ